VESAYWNFLAYVFLPDHVTASHGAVCCCM